MFRWQHCPRCKEKLRIERDEYGWYVECIMCGYTHDLKRVNVRQRNNDKGARKFHI